MESLVEKQKISILLEIYGELLTDRQKDFLDLYYNEDLSYGEIADSAKISRQAVHDTINHGKKSLLRFEKHLGLADKKNAELSEPVMAPQSDAKSNQILDMDEIREQIKILSQLVSVDITYDMIPIQRQVKRLREMIDVNDE
ncbi:MAG: DNA-binding protein [Candidatus Omnitrophica bacterium]|nr:DNA-binding protein [Candidatus Omnitrophota bacterium]